MLDNWAKIAAIVASVVIIAAAIITPSIGGIFWLAQLDSDVSRLQDDVDQLKSDVEQLQDGQRAILDYLQRLENNDLENKANLSGHTHDPDGRPRLPLNTR